MTVTPSHVGICVADVERSTRFYCEGLGFEAAEKLPSRGGADFAAFLEVDSDPELISAFLRNGATTLELLHYTRPAPTGEPSTSRGRIGLTHMAFHVPDSELAAKRLVELGGTRLAHADLMFGEDEVVTVGGGPMSNHCIFMADPDGVRIELLQWGPAFEGTTWMPNEDG